MHGFEMTDILSINIDEARSIARKFDESAESRVILDACINKLEIASETLSQLRNPGR